MLAFGSVKKKKKALILGTLSYTLTTQQPSLLVYFIYLPFEGESEMVIQELASSFSSVQCY